VAVLRGRADGITLLDLDSGRELATIDQGSPLCFNADGSQLAAYNEETRRLMIWDLRRIREQLAALKLDWDPPLSNRVVALSRPTGEGRVEGESLSSKPPLRLTILDRLPKDPHQRRAELAGKIPARDANTSPRLVDLSEYYNFVLAAMPGEVPDNNLAGLPTGIQRLAGVDFDVRGGIVVRAKDILPDFPSWVGGIRVDQRCDRLHFLCALALGMPPGIRAGTLSMHLAGGAQSELPLTSGVNIENWWGEDGKPRSNRPAAVWTGQNPFASRHGFHLQLFKATWENPRPAQSVESVTFRSELREAAPFLLAITAE